MNKKILFGLFLALAAVQIAVPASMIVQRETTLREGRLYKFKTAPVDPADAFRGRYVALSMEENEGASAPNVSWTPDQSAYAELTEDSDGFAHIGLVTPWKPKSRDYIGVRVQHMYGSRAYVALPFDRYYMNEEIAPQAEHAQREESAYVAVRVRNGEAVIEGLYVGGMRIEDYVRKNE